LNLLAWIGEKEVTNPPTKTGGGVYRQSSSRGNQREGEHL